MNIAHSSSPIGPDGVVRCFNHAPPASLKRSSTAANPDRNFYCCSLPQEHADRCGFFYWQDELCPDMQQWGDGIRARQTQVVREPSSSPPKGKRPSLTDDDVRLTPSQKRMKIIEQALSRPDSPSESPDIRRRSSTQPSSLQPPSTPVKRSRSSENRASIDNTKVAGNGKPHASSPGGSFIEDERDRLTPPPSNPTRSQDGGPSRPRSGILSPSPLSRAQGRKLKRGSFDTLTHLDDISGGTELVGSYDQPRVSRRLDFSQPPPLLQDLSNESTSEAIARLAECAHMFNPRLEPVLGDLPNILAAFRKSERKRVAAEKSAEAKAKRIAVLTKEVTELKEMVEELKKRLH